MKNLIFLEEFLVGSCPNEVKHVLELGERRHLGLALYPKIEAVVEVSHYHAVVERIRHVRHRRGEAHA